MAEKEQVRGIFLFPDVRHVLTRFFYRFLDDVLVAALL